VSRLSSANSDLAIAILWALLAGLLVVIGDAPTLVRSVVALPLVFVLPGYVLLEALSPRDAGDRANERVALTIGLSLAVCALGALLLNLFTPGLRASTWTALLGSVTVLGAAAAMTRRDPNVRPALRRPRPRSVIGGCAAATAILAIVVAMLISHHGAEQQAAGQRFSQLWMLPEGGEITVGVHSEEPVARRSTLELAVDGRVKSSWTLALAPNQTWVKHLPRPASAPGQRVIAELLIPGRAPLKVWLWTGKPA
jgi:hypothetical protein